MADHHRKLQFRTATPDDAPQVQQLIQSAFRADDSRPDWTGHLELASNFRIELDEITANIANPDMVTLIAFTPPDENANVNNYGDNNPASLVASISVSKRGTDVARLSMIAVDERYQRGGVGRQVLEYAEDYCHRTWGVTKFSLDALSTRKALIEWYIRRGYGKTGETTLFPREKFKDLALPEDMCFIEFEKDLK
ncbi:GNAT family acetyltransferase, putative [Paecilomyces variotii No. 5]|uniref:GNAT family acetyltransferase, putative n=1 Tax=Byssochlamys spectabilis (strain No. 5 / NBRC 109023) TaxID=1356009 RepID=V5FY25_BYSSN|nr:GNAT family acetyltransferase, putative [Paecilomyces variotii No. 5]